MEALAALPACVVQDLRPDGGGPAVDAAGATAR